MRKLLSFADIIIQAVFILLIILVWIPISKNASPNTDILDGLIMCALGYVYISSAVHVIRLWKRKSNISIVHKIFFVGLFFFSGIVLGSDFTSQQLRYSIVPISIFFCICIWQKKAATVRE